MEINILSDIENNKNLYGKIPNINYATNYYQDDGKCNFGGTSLCYSKEDENPLCSYPTTYYNCTECIDDNSSLVEDLCQCNEGYSGVGYIKCYSDDKYDFSKNKNFLSIL